MNILIADDNENNRYLQYVLLKSQGHKVLQAKNGMEALQIARSNPPDIIISDILMPGMDGFALCHEWKNDVNLRHIPFVFYTSTYSAQDDEAFARNLGADKFLVKPMEAQAFLDSIYELVERGATKPVAQPISNQVDANPESEHNDENYFLQYNSRLIHKLEKKLADLEQANRKLMEKENTIIRLNQELETRVTQRTRELEISNKELESFAYSVSHDLRTPLRAMLGYSSILLEDYGESLDAQGNNYIEHIYESGIRMTRLIEDLLGLSRIGRISLSINKVNVSDMARQVIAEIREQDPERQIDINIQDGMQSEGDAGLLDILLKNLLGNAWKYSQKQPRPRIDFECYDDPVKGKVYMIKDNGVGFDMRYAEKLFSPFKRLHHDADFEGSGIGLATVKRIIQSHGGDIWFSAEPDKGARFYFTLSLASTAPVAEPA